MTTSTKYGQVSYATTGEIPQESASNLEADRKRWFANWITNLRAKADRHTMQVHDSRKEDERVLKQQVSFSVSSNGEKLVKATKCFLWTTAGPIAGKLFLSTEKVAFLGHLSVGVTSSSADDGCHGTDVARVPYKVFVPLARIKKARLSEQLSRPSEKYVQITTIDDFELWFVGVVGYHKFFKYLQRTIAELHKERS